MCLIIASEKGVLPESDLFENAIADNGDGFGAVWSENGKLKTYKTLRPSKARRFLPTLEGRPYVMHFRLATHGRVDIENTHPFPVTRHLFMAHNGIIPWSAVKGSARSDSWHFARLIASTMDGDRRAEGFERMLPGIEDAVGKSNKLAFLRSDGRIFFANEGLGVEHGGLWLSNSYSLPGTPRMPDIWADIRGTRVTAPACSPGRGATLTAGGGRYDWGCDYLWDVDDVDNDDDGAALPDWSWGTECDGCNAWSADGHARCTVDGVTMHLCQACRSIFFGDI